MKKPVLLFLASLCFISCDFVMKKRDNKDKEATEASKKVVLGTDKDENGCVASAGYRWSVLKNECIRPVEECYRLNTIEQLASESDVTSAYVAFEEDGGNRAELFLPGTTNSIILKQDGKSDPYKDKNWILYSQNGYKLKKNGNLLYAGAAAVQEGQITGDDQQEQD